MNASLNLTFGDPLAIDRIRSVLVRLEDTIIFSLIERAQFAHNPRIYQRGAIPELVSQGFKGSWLEWFLKEIESFHAKARRYTSPDEYPFTSDLPPPVLPSLTFPELLHPNQINVNSSILAFYVSSIVPNMTRQATLALAASRRAQGIKGDLEFEDDGNYGTASLLDVDVLQNISKRVHYGKFVSESKFRDAPAKFIPYILKKDRHQLEMLITKPEVEAMLLSRLEKKASTYGQPINNDQPVGKGQGIPKIDAAGVVELYESFIIPLTKEVEVEYLLHRLDGLSQDDIDRMLDTPIVNGFK